MDLVYVVVATGVLGTLMMDVLNHLFARVGIISKIDMAIIGRMAAGWAGWRFRYRHPSDMEQKAHEKLYGVVTHYTIGVSLAFPYVGGWELLTGEPASPVWAIVYGIATTAASWFIVYPSMGFGMFGLRSPEGLKASLSSLANHLFFGMGIAAGLVIM